MCDFYSVINPSSTVCQHYRSRDDTEAQRLDRLRSGRYTNTSCNSRTPWEKIAWLLQKIIQESWISFGSDLKVGRSWSSILFPFIPNKYKRDNKIWLLKNNNKRVENDFSPILNYLNFILLKILKPSKNRYFRKFSFKA